MAGSLQDQTCPARNAHAKMRDFPITETVSNLNTTIF
jgi:hypothetical protein